ncbi:CotH kinase family protein [Cohnella panacarvi]|uniref:CotH kinase family protein n=1 Tax=Cohnella panacarvi TaxID=400776 RepID=UPI00047C710F|nr:CotH kinase family protein [Cohnella panacarvi]
MTLPVRELRFRESAALELEKNLWKDRYVSAIMQDGRRSAPVRIRYRGGHTRGYPKRSYEVASNGVITHYNAEYDDPSMIRNALSFAFFNRIGVHAPMTRHVRLSVNGRPAGVYLEIEGVGRPFFRRRGIAAEALFYAVNNHANFEIRDSESSERKPSLLSGYEHRFGGQGERTRLAAFIRALGEDGPASAIRRTLLRVDADNYLRWLAGAVLTGNYDGFEQNYAIYRSRRTGRYRMVPWDYEGTWGRNCYGRVVDSNLVSVTGYNRLTRKLLEQRAIRDRYVRLLSGFMNGPFTERWLMPVANEMLARLAPHIRKDESQRWSYREFTEESSRIRTYIRERRERVRAELSRL